MLLYFFFFFFTDTATTEIYTLSLHDALPISLHETVRVDVDVEHQVAARLHAAQPLPQHRLKRYIAACFHQKAPAMAAAQQSQRRRRGAEHMDAVLMRRRAREVLAEAVNLVRIAAGEDDGCQPSEWRHAGDPPLLRFQGIEAIAVAGLQRLHDRAAGV